MVATIVLGRVLPQVAGGLDFFLMVVVYYAITRSRIQGIWMGAAAGLVQDVLGSQVLGFYAFVKTGVAYLVGGMGSKFILNHPFPRFLSLLLATILDAALVALLTVMAGLYVPFRPGQVGRAALLNSVVGLILFRVVSGRRGARAPSR